MYKLKNPPKLPVIEIGKYSRVIKPNSLDHRYDYLDIILSTELYGSTYQFVGITEIPGKILNNKQTEYLRNLKEILGMQELLKNAQRLYMSSRVHVRLQILTKRDQEQQKQDEAETKAINSRLEAIKRLLRDLRPADELKDTDGGFPFIFELIEGSTKRRYGSKNRWWNQFIPAGPFSPYIKAKRWCHQAFDKVNVRVQSTNADSSPPQQETSRPSPHDVQPQQTATLPHADGPPASTAD